QPPPNQGQFQVKFVGTNLAQQSLMGDLTAASHLGASPTYTINDGKIVTELEGTPIATAVYKLGDKYYGARSNEFGYANYAIVPAVTQVSPLGVAPKTPAQ